MNCELVFEVIDTGIGMTKSMQKRIFSPFQQGDSSINRRYGGTGLGLVISRQLVTLMGGNLYVESEFNKGSHFTFNLNFKILDDIEHEPLIQPLIEDYRPNEMVQDFKILLVEDNETNIQLMQLMLQKLGFTCDVAFNGLEAFEATKKRSYDLILMDCQMPIMDGYEATQTIKEFFEKAHTPIIIALTANAFPDDQKKMFGEWYG